MKKEELQHIVKKENAKVNFSYKIHSNEYYCDISIPEFNGGNPFPLLTNNNEKYFSEFNEFKDEFEDLLKDTMKNVEYKTFEFSEKFPKKERKVIDTIVESYFAQ